MLWIIDGNNLIHSDSVLRDRMKESGLDSAVDLLCDELAKVALSGHRFQLVFDSGQGRRGSSAVEVLIAPHGKSADELILSLVRSDASQEKIQVVTDDLKDIAKRAPGGRIQRCSCGEFRSKVISGNTKSGGGPGRPRKSEKPPAPRSKNQIDYWMDQFSGD
ncbi:MAG: hypothetical protein CBC13_10870 [Planctomycetia bacterium TMED53]|nr:MAG: hypothetical protein CBC13_10870 [Planctomycetia bacterium TMED53]